MATQSKRRERAQSRVTSRLRIFQRLARVPTIPLQQLQSSFSLARAAVRDIVGAKNLQGVTALDYAVARGDAVVTDLISTYSKAHLDEDNIDDYLLGEHAVRGYRASRSASCAARRSK